MPEFSRLLADQCSCMSGRSSDGNAWVTFPNPSRDSPMANRLLASSARRAGSSGRSRAASSRTARIFPSISATARAIPSFGARCRRASRDVDPRTGRIQVDGFEGRRVLSSSWTSSWNPPRFRKAAKAGSRLSRSRSRNPEATAFRNAPRLAKASRFESPSDRLSAWSPSRLLRWRGCRRLDTDSRPSRGAGLRPHRGTGPCAVPVRPVGRAPQGFAQLVESGDDLRLESRHARILTGERRQIALACSRAAVEPAESFNARRVSLRLGTGRPEPAAEREGPRREHRTRGGIQWPHA